MSDYDMSIHSNPDATAWAKFYKETFPEADEDLMRGWFANAMMAMHDHLQNGQIAQLQAELAEVRAENARLREEADDVYDRYNLLATEMVYEGNSVQHWKHKALAYKQCAGIVYQLKTLLAEIDGSAALEGGEE